MCWFRSSAVRASNRHSSLFLQRANATMRSCLGGAAAAAAAAALVMGAPVGAFHIAARPSIIGKVQYRSASSRSPLQLASASSALALSDDNNDISASSTGLAIPRWQRFSRQFRTLLRVGFPSVVAGVAATLIFPALARLACTVTNSAQTFTCLLYTSPSPRDRSVSRMPSSA